MQRVEIARALVNNPDIILADEPTGALDTKTSVQVMEILKKISKDKLIIMVTHNPELDVVGVMMDSVSQIINTISYVLIAFVAISLIVSSIMIGIITYISVLERTKEIGGIILVVISMLLTIIAGLIPAKMASKRDPVEALRTE